MRHNTSKAAALFGELIQLEQLGEHDTHTHNMSLYFCVLLQVRQVAARRRDTVCISGLTGDGLEPLMDLISAKLAQTMVEVGCVLCVLFERAFIRALLAHMQSRGEHSATPLKQYTAHLSTCFIVSHGSQVDVYLPYSAGDVLNDIHTAGTLLEEPDYTATGESAHTRSLPH